jgi:hypothetical protein
MSIKYPNQVKGMMVWRTKNSLVVMIFLTAEYEEQQSS